jgi:flagellar hook-length control protein FliK
MMALVTPTARQPMAALPLAPVPQGLDFGAVMQIALPSVVTVSEGADTLAPGVINDLTKMVSHGAPAPFNLGQTSLVPDEVAVKSSISNAQDSVSKDVEEVTDSRLRGNDERVDAQPYRALPVQAPVVQLTGPASKLLVPAAPVTNDKGETEAFAVETSATAQPVIVPAIAMPLAISDTVKRPQLTEPDPARLHADGVGRLEISDPAFRLTDSAEPTVTLPQSPLVISHDVTLPRIDAAPASTPVHSASSLDLLSSDAWIDQLASDIVAARSSDDRLSFRLRPDHLGTLDVTIDNQPAGLSIALRVESDEAAAILNASTPRLADDLRQQGLKIDQAHVDLRQEGQQGRSAQQQPHRPAVLPDIDAASQVDPPKDRASTPAIPTQGVRLA